MRIQTLKDIKELKNKKILLRVDFNVPLNENGEIDDDTRIVEALPTIRYLQEEGAKIIIVTHLGRPNGVLKNEFRLTTISKHLEKLIKNPIKKTDSVLGQDVKEAVTKMKDGDIIMLENIRCRPEEEACEINFTKELASLGDIFVMDAFGTAHRKHASTAGLAEFLPTYAGLLMEKELSALTPLVEGNPTRPLTMIFGGAKMDTKIDVIKNFLEKADYFLMGGALANTFLSAAGYNVAESLFEQNKVEIAREIMLECEKHHEKFILPHDVICASKISEEAETVDIPIEDVIGDMKILDIGKWTAQKYCDIIKKSGTVIWNGPLGLTEHKPFQNGTKMIAQCLSTHKCNSIIGGGDTANAINDLGIQADKFTHISTGGGAAIEFLSGHPLPGIEILKA